MAVCNECGQEKPDRELTEDWKYRDYLYCEECIREKGYSKCSNHDECGRVITNGAGSHGLCEECEEYHTDPYWKQDDPDWDDSHDPDYDDD